jgi:hypothetical protein
MVARRAQARKQRWFGIGRTSRAAARAGVAASLKEAHMLKRLRMEPISSHLERRRKGLLFPERRPGAHFSARAELHRAVRYRGRLRGGDEIRRLSRPSDL